MIDVVMKKTKTSNLLRSFIVCFISLIAILPLFKIHTAEAQQLQNQESQLSKIQTPQINAISATGINPNKTSLKNNSIPLFSLSIGDSENSDDLVPALRVVAILTILSIAPAILLLMSAFTRILIVLGFVRQALGSPTMPPNQVLIGLSLFLTYFVMAPTTTKIYDTAIVPYMAKTMSAEEAFERAQTPIKTFMLNQVRKEDVKLFLSLSAEKQPEKPNDIPMRVLIPSFVISELKSAFLIGFLVYLPFIIIDMIVSSVLMAMGMMMLPPTVVSLPLKIILFVVVDGWNLLASSLIRSFS